MRCGAPGKGMKYERMDRCWLFGWCEPRRVNLYEDIIREVNHDLIMWFRTSVNIHLMNCGRIVMSVCVCNNIIYTMTLLGVSGIECFNYIEYRKVNNA